ncbi:MAG: hypothetical protein A3E25_14545 [Burkholderiales bacterium RIFCSPHIGHO2_12_FULL_69_20]|nr:MAG: hypothetical protein A3E25_14545 [Burkholderiales bacterium RIFCSPHIGHO2_12_FULL_69_20]
MPKFYDATAALAQSLADGPRSGHAMTKTLLWQARGSGLSECSQAEAQALRMQTNDFQCAPHAFAAKHRPVFGDH